MIIRTKQFNAFMIVALKEFEDRAVTELRTSYPQQLELTPDDQLRRDIRKGMERANSYGLEDETWVMEFLGYLVEYGEDFGATPETEWGGEVLKRKELSEEEKIKLLARRRLSQRL